MTHSFTFKLAAIAIASGLLAGGARAQQRTLKLATQTTAGTATYDASVKFADLVKAKTGGKLAVKVYGGGTLGKDVAVVSAMQGGTVELCVMNSSLLAGVVREMGILDFPFVFDNEKEAYAVLDGAFGKKLHGLLTPKGVVGLSYWEQGWRQFHTGKKQITKADDLAGMKIRVIETPIYTDFMKAMGANPTPLPYPELYSALEQKAIDGGTQPVTNVVNAKLYEVQKYLTITNHMYSPQSILIGRKAWDSLSPAEQKAVQEAADEARDFQRKLSQERNAQGLEELKKTMTINALPPAELAKMAEKARPVVARYTQIVGAPLVAEMNAEVARLRGAK
ncbi:MAG: DctP family TRAP transporter solute-binding subunit [Burkholderiaceae bacterium]|nr:DctP family TRAP transporter solute-binding subunit [Burkholderiaceae bacterium]